MSARSAPSLSLLTLNVNGLGDRAKRSTLFHSLLQGPWDVILLQETHHRDDEQGIQWCREGAGEGRPWPGVSFWAHGTTASRGVAILIRDTIDLGCTVLERVDVDIATSDLHEPQGRVLRVDFSWGHLQFSVFSVYAPCTSIHRPSFFIHQLLPHIPQGRHLIIGGDFNCVGSDLDVTPNAFGTRRGGYTGGLDTIQYTFGLSDLWREQHPSDRMVTHICPSSMTGARLDRFLVSTDVLLHCTSSSFVEGLPGDHLGASMRIISPQGVAQGPKPWTFPIQLTDDATFVAHLHALVQTYVTDHPISATMSHRIRWDGLKAEIRDYCTEYQRLAALKRSALHQYHVRRAQMAREGFIQSPTDSSRFEALQHAQRELDAFVVKRAQESVAKSGALWQLFGEQSTFYFYHTMQRRKTKTSWTSVTTVEGVDIPLDTAEDRERAGAAFQAFFSSASSHGLFRPRQCDDAAQAELLDSIDSRLSTEDRQAGEGDEPLTLEELTDSLKAMPRGKKPGSDGIPYEFLQAFWPILGPLLLQVFLEAFHDETDPLLSPSQRSGVITMLYKGSGSKSDPASYRPLTLLNTDVKLLGKALSDRWLPLAAKIIDSTQSAFLPQRWIGDNILAHLETVDFSESHGQPGCIAFLDFSKAYDRLDRGWLDRALDAQGFGPQARKWVRLIHSGLGARVRFNNWLSPHFPVSSGVAQGSPLSPLLYILAAQPLAAHLRLMVREGSLLPFAYPGGGLGPPCYQHADDTTLVLASRGEVKKAIDGSLALFCRASGSQLNASKSKAMLIGPAPQFEGRDPDTDILYVARGDCVRHLGVQLSTDTGLATKRTYSGLEASVRAATQHWSAKQLTYLGRVHVAKQALASKITFHATYLPIPHEYVQRLSSVLVRFVTGSGDTMHPGRAIHALPWDRGGMGLTPIAVAASSLQAKVISRLLEPERLPWKQFFLAHFRHDTLFYGVRWMFSTRRTQDIPITNPRAKSYVNSFKRLGVGKTTYEDPDRALIALAEPVFYNPHILVGESPITPFGIGSTLLQASIYSLGDFYRHKDILSGEVRDTLLAALPHHWRTHLSGDPFADTMWHWDGGTRACLKQAGEEGTTWSHFSIAQDGHLDLIVDSGTHPTYDIRPAVVVLWDPARRWRPGKKHPPRPAHYILGDVEPAMIHPGQWTAGQMPCSELIVREATACLSIQAAVKARVLASPTSSVRPPMWQDSEAGSIDGPEDKWVKAVLEYRESQISSSQPTLRRTAQQAGLPDYTAGAAWMSQSPAPRLHWRTRQLTQPEPEPEPGPPLEGPEQPQGSIQQPWKKVWGRLVNPILDREHRYIAWQVLHSSLPCGALMAFRKVATLRTRGEDNASIRAAVEAADCPFCSGTPQTITHMLFTCPTAQTVWQWAVQVWSLVTQLPPPHLTASLLLRDDRRTWNPSKEGEALWDHIRLAAMAGLVAAAKSKRKGLPASHHTAAAYAVHHLRTAMRTDWLRVAQSNSSAVNALAEGTCCTSWLRGRSPALTPAQFRQVWNNTDAICSVSHLGQLICHLTLSHPVSLG